MPIAALMAKGIYYPDSDGKPLGETPQHIRNIFYALDTLETWYAGDPHTCVAGDMFVYYEEGNPRKHVSPDAFVSRRLAAKKWTERRRYLVWEEGKAPDVVVEFTSPSTRDEDLVTKMAIYRDILKVREYFLFDPHDEYLQPRLQGFRLVGDEYVPIEPVDGRLPSEVLELHLEGDGPFLRFYDPVQKRRLPIAPEVQEAQKQAAEALQREEQERARDVQAREEAEAARTREEQARQQAEAEVERLRRELDELRRRLP